MKKEDEKTRKDEKKRALEKPREEQSLERGVSEGKALVESAGEKFEKKAESRLRNLRRQ